MFFGQFFVNAKFHCIFRGFWRNDCGEKSIKYEKSIIFEVDICPIICYTYMRLPKTVGAERRKRFFESANRGYVSIG